VADAAPLAADPRRAQAARSVGVERLPARIQGRSPGRPHRAGHGAARRPAVSPCVFEQLGEDRLEGAITTDIVGKPDSFATRLDSAAVDPIKKARLHRKVATSIFFESSGGQQHKEASLPEIRLAVSEPSLDMGNIETVLEELQTNCYFLTTQNNRYRFSLTPNLNKLLSDRRANIKQPRIVKPPIIETPPIEQGRLTWAGQVPAQKWMNFYSKVPAKFVNAGDLTVTVSVSASPRGGLSPHQVEETKSALRELGLSPEVESR
jgi:hypothetical protein